MTVPNSGECGGPAPPPPPPPTSSAPLSASSSPRLAKEGTADTNLLLSEIRNGVSLKPTKTKDKSTPAFIKKSGGAGKSPSPSPTHLNGSNGDVMIVEMKDALQQELRNTLKRKVKTQDVERGDCTKKEEIEKSMEINRTEVQLKVNTKAPVTPTVVKKDVVDTVVPVIPKTETVQNETKIMNGNTPNVKPVSEGFKSPVLQRTPTKPPRVMQSQMVDSGKQTTSVKSETQQNGTIKPETVSNESSPNVKKISEVFQSPVLQRPPSKTEKVTQNKLAENSKPVVSSTTNNVKEPTKAHTPVKIQIKPFESSRTPLNGTLRKVSPQKALTIDVNVSQDDRLKNTILSPDVKSGNAAIRPSQIKSLTQQGSHVSHTDILENPKPINKSPISMGESPTYVYSPPTPKTISPASSDRSSSPRTPTRTTILDTKLTNGVGRTYPASPKVDPNAPPKKLMMTHPKASFTLKRNVFNSSPKENGQQEPKPVFRILSNLEQSESMEAAQEQKVPLKQQPKAEPPKADEPGEEPILTSYVSFSKELANAPNNYPDVVTKTTTVGVVKQDLFFDNTNLRDIKIDIIEGGGQFKVVSK